MCARTQLILFSTCRLSRSCIGNTFSRPLSTSGYRSTGCHTLRRGDGRATIAKLLLGRLLRGLMHLHLSLQFLASHSCPFLRAETLACSHDASLLSMCHITASKTPSRWTRCCRVVSLLAANTDARLFDSGHCVIALVRNMLAGATNVATHAWLWTLSTPDGSVRIAARVGGSCPNIKSSFC